MLRLTHFSGVKFEKNGNAKVKHLTNSKSANATDRLHQGDDYIYQRTKNQCWKWWFCPKWGLCLWCVRCLNWQQNQKEKESQHNGIGQAKNEIAQKKSNKWLIVVSGQMSPTHMRSFLGLLVWVWEGECDQI